jgi:multiple antibiotic resistance protein
MLAGPGSISLLIAFYSEHQQTSEIIISVLAMIAVAIAIFIILRSAHYLAKILGAELWLFQSVGYCNCHRSSIHY